MDRGVGGTLLEARLSASYGGRAALSDVRIEVGDGEIVGVVGESGAGKSTLAAALMRLERFKGAAVEGAILFEGRDLMRAPESELRRIRGCRIAMVHQSAAASLNPALTLERQMKEAWRAHSARPWRDAEPWVEELMRRVGLPPATALLKRRPAEVSGGEAQRLLICMSLLHRPKLLVADEPNSSVDSINRAEINALLQKLNEELGTSVLLITHDLLSVARICSRVYVLHEGGVAEQGAAAEILGCPRHPFTRRLVEAWSGLDYAVRPS